MRRVLWRLVALWALALLHVYLAAGHLVGLATHGPAPDWFASLPLWWTHCWKGGGAVLAVILLVDWGWRGVQRRG